MKNRLGLRALCEAAIMIALAQILSYLTFFRMPQGGSVDIAMLPIIVYSVRWGLGRGLIAGFVHGILQYFLGNGIAISWVSMICDYVVAFTVLGFAGVFRGKRYGAVWGTILGGFLRFLVHYTVGATVWAEYMPEEFFGLTMTSPWFYSALYNGWYMAVDIVLVAILSVILCRVLKKYMTAQDIIKAS